MLLALALFSGLATAQTGEVAALPTEDPPVERLHPMLAPVIQQGPFAPSWASLVTHPLPSWFRDAKVGLSAHWGPYCVPGWTPRKDTPYGVAYAEWYWQWMMSNEAVKEYHARTYGDAPYDAFIDGTPNLEKESVEGFFAKDFDADAWMDLFTRAGVQYFFITVKHHDGFCLFDSDFTHRDAVEMGPKRDLYGELVAAARERGIRVGLYYSFYEWFNPAYAATPDPNEYAGFQPLTDRDLDGNDSEYVDDFMVPQIKELIDRYHPDSLCFDGEWEHGYPFWRARQIVAYYYNQAAERGQEVVVNDRFGQKKEGTSDTRGVYGDFYHVEYHADIDRAKPWAMWRGFGNSYGYNRNEHPDNILSPAETIRMVVDVVSDNGNIEFNLGPKADGTLAEFEVERLEAMGQWLGVNGESIYGTRKSPFGAQTFGRTTYDAGNHRLYVHVYEWPENGELLVSGAAVQPSSARLLARPESPVVCEAIDGGGLRIRVEGPAPDEAVSVIAIEYEGEIEPIR
ncbi:Alpha-L-fucosidase [Planctomycetes bacterium Poly30]|uniref:alpha-L-fucosidase n=2 Tax=Saltatorellus ferox TaxID=2528018 RepID=A0A518F0Y8_9BACT|nr:Alpha-L-fucosidase [Planctomycetes bacterium Poly30]